MKMRYGTLFFIFCACLAAQPARPVRELAVTFNGDGDNEVIRVRNQYSSPATAWILQCETPTGGSRHYSNDQDLSFQTKPIAAGEEIEFKIPPRNPAMMQQTRDQSTCADFHAIAAVFADGTVSGDLRWIEAVVADRRQAYQDIAKATEILNTASTKGTDTADVVKQIADWQKSNAPAAMTPRPVATYGPNWGWQSNGTAPPRMRMFRSPVPGATLWLIETQAMKLPDAVKALSEWRDRLAKLAPVAETGSPSPAPMRNLMNGPFTPPADPELLGKPAPDFTLKDVDGGEVKLSALRGKPVLLDFWATWCEPCRESMPHVQSLHEQFKDMGLVVLGIDTNEPADKARQYFADQKYSFANLLGAGNDVVKNYGANSIPRLILIDKDGMVRYAHTGWGNRMDVTPEVKKVVEP